MGRWRKWLHGDPIPFQSHSSRIMFVSIIPLSGRPEPASRAGEPNQRERTNLHLPKNKPSCHNLFKSIRWQLQPCRLTNESKRNGPTSHLDQPAELCGAMAGQGCHGSISRSTHPPSWTRWEDPFQCGVIGRRRWGVRLHFPGVFLSAPPAARSLTTVAVHTGGAGWRGCSPTLHTVAPLSCLFFPNIYGTSNDEESRSGSSGWYGPFARRGDGSRPGCWTALAGLYPLNPRMACASSQGLHIETTLSRRLGGRGSKHVIQLTANSK